MSANVGLTTPRGSGTSGYVQKNLSLLRQVTRDRGAPYSSDPDEFQRHQQRKPDAEILEHDRKRRIENKVFELRDKLEEEEVDEDEIEAQVDALRKKLTAEDQASSSRGVDRRGLKSHQVHDLAAAKIQETEKLRKALGIREDYQEGSHWKRGEERIRESVQERPPPAARTEARGRDMERDSPSLSPSLSPPRSPSRSPSRSRSRTRSETPPRRSRRRDSSSDRDRSRSPPRRRRRYSSGARSPSPVRRRRNSPSSRERDASPRQRRRRRNSSSDESRSRSPPRRRRDSPPPKRRRDRSYSSYDSESDGRRSRSR